MRLNVGAGRERFPGWFNLDLEPGIGAGGSIVEVSPDVIGSADSLPFDDSTITTLRTRDLLMDYEAEYGGSLRSLIQEFYRVLKPGGRWIAIEVRPFSNLRTGLFEVSDVRLGGKISYMSDLGDDEVEGVGRNYYLTVYKKR